MNNKDIIQSKDILVRKVVLSRIETRGDGVSTKVRRIFQVFTLDGELLAEDDPCPDPDPRVKILVDEKRKALDSADYYRKLTVNMQSGIELLEKKLGEAQTDRDEAIKQRQLVQHEMALMHKDFKSLREDFDALGVEFRVQTTEMDEARKEVEFERTNRQTVEGALMLLTEQYEKVKDDLSLIFKEGADPGRELRNTVQLLTDTNAILQQRLARCEERGEGDIYDAVADLRQRKAAEALPAAIMLLQKSLKLLREIPEQPYPHTCRDIYNFLKNHSI
jgi:hypothetical protein